MKVRKIRKKIYFDLEDKVKEIVGNDVTIVHNQCMDFTFSKGNIEIAVSLEFYNSVETDVTIWYDFVYSDEYYEALDKYANCEEDECEYDYDEYEPIGKNWYFLIITSDVNQVKDIEIQSFIDLDKQLREIKKLLEY